MKIRAKTFFINQLKVIIGYFVGLPFWYLIFPQLEVWVIALIQMVFYGILYSILDFIYRAIKNYLKRKQSEKGIKEAIAYQLNKFDENYGNNSKMP